ncbi:MAG: O-antigen ligase family protein [Actinomycetota bacterium]
MNVAQTDLSEAPGSSRRSRGSHQSAGGLFWLFAALLVAVTAAPLPNGSAWLSARAFAVEVVAIVLAVSIVSSGQWTRARVLAALTALPNMAIGAFLLWVGVSAARSDLPELSRYEAMRHLSGGLIYFSIVYGFSVRRHLAKLVVALLVAASLASLLAFFTATEGRMEHLSGALRNHQLLAGLLCLSLPIILVVSQMDEEPWRRYGAQAAAVIVIAGLLISKNRSAWLGAAVALLVLGALYLRFSRRGERISIRRHQLLLPVVTLLLAGGLCFTVAQIQGGLSQRALSLSRLTQDSSFQWRLAMWDKALRMANQKPIAGWGIGSYPVQQALFFHAAAPSREQRAILATGPRLTENAHNTYAQMAAEIGYVGLLFYLAVFGAFFYTSIRSLANTRLGFRHAILLGATAAVAGQMVAAIGTPAWEFPECSLFLWVILAFGMAAAGVGSRGREPEVTGRSVQH